MGETKEPQQGIPPQGPPPVKGTGTTPEKAKTYTEEDLQKVVQAALTQAGRDAKSLTQKERELATRTKTIEQQERELTQWRQQKEQAELEQARSDPNLLSAYQAKQMIREKETQIVQERARLESERAQMNDQMAELNKMVAEHTANTLAPGTTLTAEELMELSDSKPERMRTLARKFPKQGASTAPPSRPDSGMTLGAKGTLSAEDVRKMTPEERWARRAEIDKIPLGL